jgi:hypothetical protein
MVILRNYIIADGRTVWAALEVDPLTAFFASVETAM